MLTVLCLAAWGKAQELASITAGIVVPDHATVTMSRKFMVLEDPTAVRDNSSPGPNLTLIIGPPLGSYYHKYLLNDSAVPGGMTQRGGGFVDFTGKKWEEKVLWRAKFHKESGDYGIYTADLLTAVNRQSLADALQMDVEFEWKTTIHPTKQK